jgi:hypothetical protein
MIVFDELSPKSSNSFETSKKSNNEDVNKQELIGDCLHLFDDY